MIEKLRKGMQRCCKLQTKMTKTIMIDIEYLPDNARTWHVKMSVPHFTDTLMPGHIMLGGVGEMRADVFTIAVF